MKKVFLTLFIALLTGYSVSAQDRGTKFGFQVSPGVSWFNPDMDGIESNKPRISFGFGAMADIPLMENIALSTGLGGNFNGGTMRYNDSLAIPVSDTGKANPSFVSEGTYKLRYVKVPLTFKGITNEIGHMRYFLEFGGSLGFNYYARMDLDGKKSANDMEDHPIKRKVRTFRATMLIRAGGEYNMTGSTNLVFGLTFDNGITRTFNPNEAHSFRGDGDGYIRDGDGELISEGGVKAITNSISVNLGVLF